MAALAATRRTAADIDSMHAAIDDLSVSTTLTGYRAADAAFHRAVALAARSERLGRAAFGARAELFFPVDHLDYEPTVAATAREHATIARAIERGDGAAAARAVTRHLEHTRTKLRVLLATTSAPPNHRPSKGAA